MIIKLLTIGKIKEPFIREGVRKYDQKLKHYCRFENLELPDIKVKGRRSPEEMVKLEGEQFLGALDSGDFVVVLDELGKEYSSTDFANKIQSWLNRSPKSIVFVIGGAYGFSDKMYKRADAKLALSRMTLTHEMCKLVMTEQLYRGFSILKGESYHH